MKYISKEEIHPILLDIIETDKERAEYVHDLYLALREEVPRGLPPIKLSNVYAIVNMLLKHKESREWIKHDGGPCPVSGKCVEVRLRQDSPGQNPITLSPEELECFSWEDQGEPWDIKEYRVVNPRYVERD